MLSNVIPGVRKLQLNAIKAPVIQPQWRIPNGLERHKIAPAQRQNQDGNPDLLLAEASSQVQRSFSPASLYQTHYLIVIQWSLDDVKDNCTSYDTFPHTCRGAWRKRTLHSTCAVELSSTSKRSGGIRTIGINGCSSRGRARIALRMRTSP
jgi:hypothetical protein